MSLVDECSPVTWASRGASNATKMWFQSSRGTGGIQNSPQSSEKRKISYTNMLNTKREKTARVPVGAPAHPIPWWEAKEHHLSQRASGGLITLEAVANTSEEHQSDALDDNWKHNNNDHLWCLDWGTPMCELPKRRITQLMERRRLSQARASSQRFPAFSSKMKCENSRNYHYGSYLAGLLAPGCSESLGGRLRTLTVELGNWSR